MSVREQLTDQERTALVEAAVRRLTSDQAWLPGDIRLDLVGALSKISGTDTEVIVMRAYPSRA